MIFGKELLWPDMWNHNANDALLILLLSVYIPMGDEMPSWVNQKGLQEMKLQRGLSMQLSRFLSTGNLDTTLDSRIGAPSRHRELVWLS